MALLVNFRRTRQVKQPTRERRSACTKSGTKRVGGGKTIYAHTVSNYQQRLFDIASRWIGAWEMASYSSLIATYLTVISCLNTIMTVATQDSNEKHRLNDIVFRVSAFEVQVEFLFDNNLLLLKQKILTIIHMYFKISLVFTVHDEPARGSWKCNLLGYFRRYFRINDPVLTIEVNLYHGVYQKYPQEQSYNHNYLLPYFISSLNDGVPI